VGSTQITHPLSDNGSMEKPCVVNTSPATSVLGSTLHMIT